MLLLNGSGNIQAEGGICWSRSKFARFMLGQRLVPLTESQKALVRARMHEGV
jgi:hypothetical protein